MTILTVGSNNPNFSFVIQKNPATIRDSNTPFKRAIRKGVAYGWFTKPDDSEFRIWFKDHEHQSSFAEGLSDEFEYLDRSRYGSPYAPIAIITECLGTVSKELQEQEASGPDDYSYASTVILIANPGFLVRMASQYWEDGIASVTVDMLPGPGDYGRVTVRAKTVHASLNILQALCIMQALSDKATYVPMNEAALLKFAKVFNRANSPYYPRYLFKMRAVHNRDTFDKVKEDLQGPGMQFVFGDTQMQRFDAIKEELRKDTSETLVDIGCGEMSHSFRFKNRYTTIYAIDADEEIAGNNIGKISGRGIDNMVATHATVNKEWIEDNQSILEGADVLLSEVLEHIEKEDADRLLAHLLLANPSRVVITVPNRDFNIHYNLEGEGFRHSDHKWEPSFEEFSDSMVSFAAEMGYSVYVKPIGDIVNDVTVTSMAVFTKEAK